MWSARPYIRRRCSRGSVSRPSPTTSSSFDDVRLACDGCSSPFFRAFAAQLRTSASRVFGGGLCCRRPCNCRGVFVRG